MMPVLAGKVALITGGNSGIGLATARLFQSEGARVAITGRDTHALAKAEEVLGPEALVLHADVARMSDLDNTIEQIRARFGRLDALFCNAGIALVKPLAEMREEDFDQLFNINAKGTFFSVQKALPLLQPGASIVLNASIAQYTGVSGMAAYGASKAAVRALGRLLAAELVTSGIRVNVVTPGPINTPIWSRGASGQAPREDVEERLIARVPMARMGDPEEVAQAVLFLASNASSYTTGSELMVDGGVVDLPAAAPKLR